MARDFSGPPVREADQTCFERTERPMFSYVICVTEIDRSAVVGRIIESAVGRLSPAAPHT